MRKAIIIVGQKGHGKTSFGRCLARELDTLSYDTSTVLTEIENDRRTRVGLPPLFQSTPEDEQSYEDDRKKYPGLSSNEYAVRLERRIKNRDRRYLIAVGDAMTRAVPTILVQACLRRGRVVVGCRRINELREAKAADLVEAVVWIQRPDYDEGGEDNLQLNIRDSDIVVANNGTLDDLTGRAQEIVEWLGDRTGTEGNQP